MPQSEGMAHHSLAAQTLYDPERRLGAAWVAVLGMLPLFGEDSPARSKPRWQL